VNRYGETVQTMTSGGGRIGDMKTTDDRDRVVRRAALIFWGLVAAGGVALAIHHFTTKADPFYCFITDTESGPCFRTSDECSSEREDWFRSGQSVERCQGRDVAFCHDGENGEYCATSVKRCEQGRFYETNATGCEER